MKTSSGIFLLISALIFLASSCATVAETGGGVPDRWDDVRADTVPKRFSYCHGYETATQAEELGIRLDGMYFSRGVLDMAYRLVPFYENEEINGIYVTWKNEGLPEGETISPADTTFDGILMLDEPDDGVKKLSYSLGFLTSYNVEKNYHDLYEPTALIRGAMDFITGTPPLIGAEEMPKLMERLISGTGETRAEMQARIRNTNGMRSENFLKDNLNMSGVYQTKSGLQYRFVNVSDGERVRAGDTVNVTYMINDIEGNMVASGTEVLMDTSAMSSSSGFRQALLLMNEGETMIAYIPPALAYGEDGGGVTEPNMLLIAEISVRKIEK